MEVRIDGKVLNHEGGTKFYEAVSLVCPATSRAVVVFRWGKVSERDSRGGGQVKIENHAGATSASDSLRKKISEKEKRGYKDSWAGISLSNKEDSETLRLRLGAKYDADTIDGILSGLGISDALTDTDTAALNHLFGKDRDIVVEEPEPEIIRGDDWASW